MKLITDLMSHQEKAVKKLRKIKVGALFMEQGTGKTRTAIELINIRLLKGRINHVIWLCPCSVKENLRRDIIKHTGTDQKGFITICGIETLSTSARWNNKLLDIAERYSCYFIVDESSKVKNFNAKRTKNIIRLSELCKYRLILNGTPVTRNEVDLFSQMYILDWRILGYKSMWSFAANHMELDEYGKFRRCLNVDYLTDKIAPYAYQVCKDECLDLPEKTYEIVYYNLTDEQDEHYEEIKNIFLSNVDEFDETTIYRLLTALQLVISGKRIEAIIEKEISYTKETEFVPSLEIVTERIKKIKKEEFFSDKYDNPRIEILLDIVKNINSKCIIFAKYTDEIETIIDILNENGYSAAGFYGKMNLKKRQDNIDRFINDVQFLVANKTCAGYGLNLQFCSYVIFYSNDFDYGTRAQAEDRVHRIGQNKNVHIIDICANNKIDERILKSLSNKENLAESIKSEIEGKKDIKEALDSWLSVRSNYNGKRYSRRMKALDKRDLLEENIN